MDRNRLAAYIEVTFAVVVWGASFIATKIALRDLAPVTVVWLRFAIGVLILGVAVTIQRQFALPSWKELIYFAVLGFLGITFHQWLQSTGLLTARASTTAWIVATTPVFIALLSLIFLHERLNWLQGVGIILAALGVVLVVSKGDLRSLLSGHFGEPGDLLIMISAPNWALFSILSRRGLQKHQATRMMFYVMTLGWLFTTLLFFTSGNISDVGHITINSLLGVGFLGVFCSGLAYIAWYDGLHAVPASQIGAFLYLEPLVAVIVAWMILQEQLSLSAILGGVIILIGVRLVQRLGP